MSRATLPGLVSLGFQVMTLSNSTAGGLNSTTRAAAVLDVSVETQAARFRADGTDPTRTTGVLLATGYHRLEQVPGGTIKFQRSTGTAKVSVQAYKYVGM